MRKKSKKKSSERKSEDFFEKAVLFSAGKKQVVGILIE